jgi:internalin A
MRRLLALAALLVSSGIPAFGQIPEGMQHRSSPLRDADLAKLSPETEVLWLRGQMGYGMDQISDAGIRHLAKLPKLRVLHAGALGLTDQSLETIGQLTNLEKLSLDSNAITGEGLKKLAGLKKLRVLNLDFNRDFDPIRIGDLGPGVPLHELLMRNSKTVNDSLLKTLSRFEHLETLYLSERYSDVSDAGLAHLAKLTKLRNLDLHFAEKVTDDGLRSLRTLTQLERAVFRDLRHLSPEGLKVLADFRQLKSLEIVSTRIDDAAMKAIGALNSLENFLLWSAAEPGVSFDHLGGLRSLKYFRTNEAIPSSAIRQLAKLQHLERLSDELVLVTDNDLAHLARLPKLQLLVLGGSKLTPQCLPSLAKMKSLRQLFVTAEIPIDAEAWQALGESLPECKISLFRPPYTVFHDPEKRAAARP